MRNKQQAIEVIQNDAEIRCQYINHEGQTCAIGGLAKAAGLDLGFLLKHTAAAGTSNGMGILYKGRYIGRVRAAIRKHFNLTPEQMWDIQERNDRFKERQDRQQSIIEYLLTLEDEGNGS